MFTIKVVKSFSKPLPRQVTEAVMIAKARSDTSIISLNSRAELRQPAIPRVIVTRELHEDNREQGRRRKGEGGKDNMAEPISIFVIISDFIVYR